jgi:NTP pyrophosphatase (non-canonical NTP hydrolase)
LDLRELQKKDRIFCEERGWEKFSSSLVLIHLYEELSEVGEYILYKDGYKKGGMGNDKGTDYENLKREFGQILSLLMQLANSFDIDLESAFYQNLRSWKKDLARTNGKNIQINLFRGVFKAPLEGKWRKKMSNTINQSLIMVLIIIYYYCIISI